MQSLAAQVEMPRSCPPGCGNVSIRLLGAVLIQQTILCFILKKGLAVRADSGKFQLVVQDAKFCFFLKGAFQGVNHFHGGIHQAVTVCAAHVIVVMRYAIKPFQTAGQSDGLDFTQFGQDL